jgi:light-regulated signal transduction histidine kinase (bacteriophytochrome)
MEREGKRLDETSRRFVATIIQSAQTAGRLVDGLLNFSRMGRASLTIVETDTGALVREVIATLSPETEGRRLAWRIAELPVVRADPVMLQQVFQNLLSNAVKYTRHRAEAVIDVGCEAGASEFVFCVRDNGAGFDMAYAHKLFGVFQRLHRIEEYEGIGIGLANVRRIVERHGGRTWAEGELGRGAAFYFTLPRAEPPPEGQ